MNNTNAETSIEIEYKDALRLAAGLVDAIYDKACKYAPSSAIMQAQMTDSKSVSSSHDMGALDCVKPYEKVEELLKKERKAAKEVSGDVSFFGGL
jgi:hypothetical protein